MPPACLPPAQPRRRKRMPMTCYVRASSPLQAMHGSMRSNPSLGAMPPACRPRSHCHLSIHCRSRATYVLVRLCRLAGAPHLPRRASRHESAGRFSGSDETAAVDVEYPPRNANKKLQRSTSLLVHDPQHNLKRMRRVQAPLHGANPDGRMPCRVLPTIPRNAQQPRAQIFCSLHADTMCVM